MGNQPRAPFSPVDTFLTSASSARRMSATWSCVRGSSFKPPAAALPAARSCVRGSSFKPPAAAFDPFLGAAAAWGVAVAAARSTLWPEK
jgi:hypothetical protein